MKKCTSIILGLGLISALLAGCRPAPQAVPTTPESIKEQILASTAPLLLVHVWATWCDPCRDEFPELVRIHTDYAADGLALLLVSADDPAASGEVEKFLASQRCPVESLIATDIGQPFIEMLSTNWSGALPASFFYRNDRLLAEWEGPRTYAQYAEVIEQLLGK